MEDKSDGCGDIDSSTSEVVAILRNDAAALERTIAESPVRLVATTCVLEARMVLARRFYPNDVRIEFWVGNSPLRYFESDDVHILPEPRLDQIF